MNSDDCSAIIALRGWHPAIARQEAISMFPESEIIRTEARRLVIANGDSDWSASEIMSGCECVLTGGGFEKWESIDKLLSSIDAKPIENMAVICWRHEGKLPVSTKEVEKLVGGIFHDAGSTFDLDNPSKRFGVILDASAGMVAWGWMTGQGPGKHGWAAMRANKRPFFRPVSLEPRLARAVVNIAAGKAHGTVIDPMCGTGGLVIESALSGRDSMGIDFDPVMVEGAKQNLQWANVQAEVNRNDATIFKLPKDVSAVVIDPPYGRNSRGDEKLLRDILTNIRSQSSCNIAVILPTDPDTYDLDEQISTSKNFDGYEISACYGIPVHKSLGRILVLAKASTQN